MALVSAPWPLYSRPSIQLGTLKAYLAAHYPDLQVQTYHLYLKIAAELGYHVYSEVSQRMWLAESVYAALLNPERLPGIQRFFKAQAVDKPYLQKIAFANLIRSVRRTTDTFLDQVDWRRFGMVGFSISLSQLTSTLYLIRGIKKKSPAIPMIIGGASLAGDGAGDLLDVFPFIDGIVIGEGELPLARIVGHLRKGRNFEELPPIKGLVTRHAQGAEEPAKPDQLSSLDDLPMPDYRDYFAHVRSLAPARRFFPVLSAEMSRGCWWQKSIHKGPNRGCAFCNLNRQWQGYREKTPDKIVAEIDALTSMHQSLSVAFMDNVLPSRTTKTIFKQLAGLRKDLSLFAEIRAGVPPEALRVMRTAGVKELQIGIEALSSRLLKKLNKGASCIDNLEIIKNCEELGIANVSNLITHFPGSDAEDVAETLRALDFAQPFRPLKTVRFWLGRGSPVSNDAKAYGLQAVYNHPHYSILLPPELVHKVRFMVQAYRGDLLKQHKLWRPVIRQVAAWQRNYAALRASGGPKPLLSFQDGRDFLIILQRRAEDQLETHRLTGASRRIYLFCRQQRSLQAICSGFPGFGEEKLRAFLNTMVAKKLMFNEVNRYLSLAVQSGAG